MHTNIPIFVILIFLSPLSFFFPASSQLFLSVMSFQFVAKSVSSLVLVSQIFTKIRQHPAILWGAKTKHRCWFMAEWKGAWIYGSRVDEKRKREPGLVNTNNRDIWRRNGGSKLPLRPPRIKAKGIVLFSPKHKRAIFYQIPYRVIRCLKEGRIDPAIRRTEKRQVYNVK